MMPDLVVSSEEKEKKRNYWTSYIESVEAQSASCELGKLKIMQSERKLNVPLNLSSYISL